eukprot:tig00020610_g11956.t1
MADVKLERKGRPPVPERNIHRIKVISMGEAGVGKSCLIKRFCEEKFVSKYISTIGVDYGVKSVAAGGRDVRINFWDLAGHPEFFEVRNEFYKDSQGAILVFDVSNKKSFEELEAWLKEAAKFGAKDLAIAVCANKTDLKKRVVDEKAAYAWAASKGFFYFETSASTGENVTEMFMAVFKAVLERHG